MGLVSKLKNILFEEEEVEIPVLEKKEKPQPVENKTYSEMPRKEERRSPSFYDDLEPVLNEERNLEQKNSSSTVNNVSSVKPTPRDEKSFSFPAFDEEEFQSVVPKPRSTNIMDYERAQKPKKQEKKREEASRVAPKPVVEEKTKFRPSPIISPVYGILDKNYTPEEITSKSPINKSLDVDSVRKKAFGNIEVPKEEKKIENIIDDKILEEKMEKARTIDELLNDSSDEVIEIPDIEEDTLEIPKNEEIINNKKTVETEDRHEEDTLESDLFDLIDSMYENGEDGE